MTASSLPSRHVVHLASEAPRYSGPKGSIAHMDAKTLSMLKRLSLRRLLLEKQGLREPHWHANAHELGYCARGEVLVTIAANHAERASFIVAKGDMFFVPSGAMHSIENIGDSEAELLLAFSHENPEDFGMKAAFGAMTDAVLGNTYDLPTAAFKTLDRSTNGEKVLAREGLRTLENQQHHISPFKYSLEATPPQIISAAGTAHTAKSAVWPMLRDMAMFSVVISDQGMREPHWHPETAEMGYVLDGTGRMTILDPDGSIDTYVIKPGDAYFIPPAYPHHIENIGEGNFHVLVFFDQPSPGDVGYRSLINVYPRDMIAASLGMAETDLPNFPFTEIDPLLVPRINPVDPIA